MRRKLFSNSRCRGCKIPLANRTYRSRLATQLCPECLGRARQQLRSPPAQTARPRSLPPDTDTLLTGTDLQLPDIHDDLPNPSDYPDTLLPGPTAPPPAAPPPLLHAREAQPDRQYLRRAPPPAPVGSIPPGLYTAFSWGDLDISAPIRSGLRSSARLLAVNGMGGFVNSVVWSHGPERPSMQVLASIRHYHAHCSDGLRLIRGRPVPGIPGLIALDEAAARLEDMEKDYVSLHLGDGYTVRAPTMGFRARLIELIDAQRVRNNAKLGPAAGTLPVRAALRGMPGLGHHRVADLREEARSTPA